MTTWFHEFSGPAGAPPDPGVWTADLGGGGWGDGQQQFYTAPPANAALTGTGQLAITARSDEAVPGRVSSARLTTRGKVAFRYGRVAARIRVPRGAGTWPAFWMLGTDIDDVGWPACGEIDVMEHVGSDPTAVHGTVHGPGYAGIGKGLGRRHAGDSRLAGDFHVYAIDWAPESLTWRIDDQEFFQVTPESVPGPWLFDRFYFLVLNLAIGGAWPGNTTDPSALPATMHIDWIRVTDCELQRAAIR